MAKGLPKWAIKEARARGAKNVFAYAWSLVKRKGKKGSRKSNPKIKRRGGRKMVRRRKRRYRRSLTIPLAPAIGLAAGFAGPMGHSPIDWAMKRDWRSSLVRLTKNYTGFDPNTGNWNASDLAYGFLPLLAGVLVHKFVGGYPLNVNKMLAQHKIPLIRI